MVKTSAIKVSKYYLLSTEDGDGFRVMSPREKEQGLTDEDLEASYPNLQIKFYLMDLTYAEITDKWYYYTF